jgi:hypothetical protein
MLPVLQIWKRNFQSHATDAIQAELDSNSDSKKMLQIEEKSE